MTYKMVNRILKSEKKIKQRLEQFLVKKIQKRKKINPRNNHYIFSDPRGGSTWLMEVIQKITMEPVIWEPLHLGKNNSPFKKLNFGWRQYIPENSDCEEAKKIFDELFSGRILTENILDHSSLLQVWNSSSLLFKICRGNALLPWLTKNYSFNYKPIYLIRHPFAVVNSQMLHGAWDYPFKGYIIPNTPHNYIYKKHKSFLESIKTKEEALVVDWCISNSIPLNHLSNNDKWLTINYEELVMNPEKTINRILTSWGVNYDLSSIDFTKNSKTTIEYNPVLGIKRLSNWQNQINNNKLDKMEEILDYFEIKCYSKNNPMPEKVFNNG